MGSAPVEQGVNGEGRSGSSGPPLPQDEPSPIPFWKRKSLAEMTKREWESLCDGCGWCCSLKLSDVDRRLVHYTDVGCRLFDLATCRCSDYAHRTERLPKRYACQVLTPENLSKYKWLPPTCGYQLVAHGRDLYWWHHLVSGDRETVHLAGMSAHGHIVARDLEVKDRELDDRIILTHRRW